MARFYPSTYLSNSATEASRMVVADVLKPLPSNATPEEQLEHVIYSMATYRTLIKRYEDADAELKQLMENHVKLGTHLRSLFDRLNDLFDDYFKKRAQQHNAKVG